MELKLNNNLWEIEIDYLTVEGNELIIRKKTLIVGIDEENSPIKQENVDEENL